MKPIINSGKILINTKENIFYALQNIYGLSSYKSINICKQLLINPNININFFKKKRKIDKIINYIKNNYLLLEDNLKRIEKYRIKLLYDLKTYRGVRMIYYSLPVRGQRTRSNHNISRKLNKLRYMIYKSPKTLQNKKNVRKKHNK